MKTANSTRIHHSTPYHPPIPQPSRPRASTTTSTTAAPASSRSPMPQLSHQWTITTPTSTQPHAVYDGTGSCPSPHPPHRTLGSSSAPSRLQLGSPPPPAPTDPLRPGVAPPAALLRALLLTHPPHLRNLSVRLLSSHRAPASAPLIVAIPPRASRRPTTKSPSDCGTRGGGM